MNCPNCNSHNAEGSNFCSNCGTHLIEGVAVVKEYLDQNLGREVACLLKSQLQDQKSVELEVAAAIAERVSNWAKLFGYFAGLAAALIVAAFAIVGIKSMGDVRTAAKQAQIDISNAYKSEGDKLIQQLGDKFQKETNEEANLVHNQAAKMLSDFEAFKARLDAANMTLTKRVNSLEEKVEQFDIKPSEFISNDLVQTLNRELGNYQKYLISLGYKPRTDKPIGVILESTSLAEYYYDDARNAIVVNTKYAPQIDISSVALREYGHRVFYSFHQYDDLTAREPASLWSIAAIESGLVTYFACSYLDRGVFDPSHTENRMDLTKKPTFAEFVPRDASALVAGSKVWGSMYWEIRGLVGKELADQRLFATWASWKPEMQGDESIAFAKRLVETFEKSDGKELANRVKKSFILRNLKL